MKNFLFTLFVMFLPISTFSKALFELEKEVDGMWNLQIVQYDTDNNYIDQLPYFNISTMSTDMGNFYCSSFTNNTYMAKVMDKNYNLIYNKIVTFNLPEDYIISTGYCTNKITDKDEMYYILMLKSQGKYKYPNKGSQKLAVFNDAGQLIYDFGTAGYIMSLYPAIWKIDGKYKIMIYYADDNIDNSLQYKSKFFILSRSSSGESYIKLNTIGPKEEMVRFNINGLKVFKEEPGIQVVVYKDGTTEKIVNK